MKDRRRVSGKTVWVALTVLWNVYCATPAMAAGWSSPGGGKWGAKVLAVNTVAATGSTVAVSYVFLESAGAVNVNTCPTYADTSNVLGTGVSSVMFLMVHSSLTAISDVQKSYLTSLQVAANAGKEVLIYSNACTSASAPGYNTIDGVWVKY